jgi:hypothetical protein
VSIYHDPSDPVGRPDLIGDLLMLPATDRVHQLENQASTVLGWLIDRDTEIARRVVALFIPALDTGGRSFGVRTQVALPKPHGGAIRPDLSVCVDGVKAQLLIEVKVAAAEHHHAEFDDALQTDAYRQAWRQLPHGSGVRAVGTLTRIGGQHDAADLDDLIARDVTWREVRDVLRDLVASDAIGADTRLVAESFIGTIDLRISPVTPDDKDVSDLFATYEPVLRAVMAAAVARLGPASKVKPIKGQHLLGARLSLTSGDDAPLFLRVYLAPANSAGNLPGQSAALVIGPERDTNGNLYVGERDQIAAAGFKQMRTLGGWSIHGRSWLLAETTPAHAEEIVAGVFDMLAQSGTWNPAEDAPSV